MEALETHQAVLAETAPPAAQGPSRGELLAAVASYDLPMEPTVTVEPEPEPEPAPVADPARNDFLARLKSAFDDEPVAPSN